MSTAAADVWAALAPPAPSSGELVKRDRYQRYLLRDPRTGAEAAWTRSTTIADTLADRRALESWDDRNIVLGLGRRRDLYEMAACAHPDDKRTLNQIARDAKAAAASASGANKGTARHRLTERLDGGEAVDLNALPADLRADAEAYLQAMTVAGIRVARDRDTGAPWIERVVIVPGLDDDGSAVGVAGTIDRLCLPGGPTWPATPLTPEPGGLPRISDLKTSGHDIELSMDKIPLQLAVYSRATHWVDLATGELHPMPPVDQDRAVVMHLPAGKGVCTLVEVDIAAGWEAVQRAVWVRRWRSTKSERCHIISVPAPPVEGTAGVGAGRAAGEVPGVEPTAPPAPPAADPAVLAATAAWVRGEAERIHVATPRNAYSELVEEVAPVERVEWLRERLATLIRAGHEALLAAAWPDGVPTPRQGGMRNRHVDQVAALCAAVEAHYELPFGPADPAAPGPVPIVEPDVPDPDMADVAGEGLPENHPEVLAALGRELLAPFEEDMREAIAACALVGNDPMTAERYDRLEAVAVQLQQTDGAIELTYDADGVAVRPRATAEAVMAAATGRSTGAKSEALARAKRLAKALDLPTPRSLAIAAENPLIAALVAAGRGAATTTTGTTSTDGKA